MTSTTSWPVTPLLPETVAQRVKVTRLVTDRADHITGVATTAAAKEPVVFHAPIVIAADGASARPALVMGLQRDTSRQISTAARRYYRSPERSQAEYLELWADLRFPGERSVPAGVRLDLSHGIRLRQRRARCAASPQARNHGSAGHAGSMAGLYSSRLWAA